MSMKIQVVTDIGFDTKIKNHKIFLFLNCVECELKSRIVMKPQFAIGGHK